VNWNEHSKSVATMISWSLSFEDPRRSRRRSSGSSDDAAGHPYLTRPEAQEWKGFSDRYQQVAAISSILRSSFRLRHKSLRMAKMQRPVLGVLLGQVFARQDQKIFCVIVFCIAGEVEAVSQNSS
jgi:hypothetical protein